MRLFLSVMNNELMKRVMQILNVFRWKPFNGELLSSSLCLCRPLLRRTGERSSWKRFFVNGRNQWKTISDPILFFFNPFGHSANRFSEEFFSVKPRKRPEPTFGIPRKQAGLKAAKRTVKTERRKGNLLIGIASRGMWRCKKLFDLQALKL